MPWVGEEQARFFFFCEQGQKRKYTEINLRHETTLLSNRTDSPLAYVLMYLGTYLGTIVERGSEHDITPGPA